MSSPNTSSLQLLRSRLDAIDRDLLQLLARRMSIVSDIAAHKREKGLRIRDLKREQEVLRERRHSANELGLPADLIEAIFRLVLLASRNQQSDMRVEVPQGIEQRTVAVIGGKGGMGSCMAELFAGLGHAVLIADLDTDLRPVDAARAADVVLISVPIRDTEAVIRELGPHVRAEALLMDVTSLKEWPLRIMLESTQASVVGTHPMFGPGVRSLQGQRVVLCPGRGDSWLEWLRQMLQASGLMVSRTTAERHDRAMAIVQVLNHYQTQVLGLALARYGMPLEESLAFTSPAYLVEAYVAARHFAQAPELYGPIEMWNPQSPAVLRTYKDAASEIAAIIERGDQAAFDAVFEEVRSFFGDFTEEALEQSSFLIDRLIELSAGQPWEENA